jgi:AcrR family transcriptional regulator
VQSVTATPTIQRPLRRDAMRNRARIVASARELFAADGIEASVEEITRHAGVGMGTLYRHFATKDELIDAVLEDAFGEWVAAAQRALAEPDAWTGFRSFLEQALMLHVANRALKDVLGGRDHDLPRAEAMRARMRPLLRRLIERAQAQGSLRADFALEDMPLLFWSSDRVIEATSAAAPELWRRHLGMLLDGLRAEAATPLAVSPMTPAQLARTTGRRPG